MSESECVGTKKGNFVNPAKSFSVTVISHKFSFQSMPSFVVHHFHEKKTRKIKIESFSRKNWIMFQKAMVSTISRKNAKLAYHHIMIISQIWTNFLIALQMQMISRKNGKNENVNLDTNHRSTYYVFEWTEFSVFNSWMNFQAKNCHSKIFIL